MKASAASIARLRRLFGKQRLDHAQDAVERAEQHEPGQALMRRLGGHADRARILQEQFVDADALADCCARGFSAASTISGTMMVRAQ